MLVNPNDPYAELREVQGAGQGLGLQVEVLNASSESDIDRAFASLTQQRVGALIAGDDPFFNSRRQQIVALAARHALRRFTWPRVCRRRRADELWHQPRGRVPPGWHLCRSDSEGEKPAELPIVQPTRFELMINLKTARRSASKCRHRCSPAPTR